MDIVGILFLLGRILFGGFFAWNGIMHIIKNSSYKPYLVSKGIKSPVIKIYLSGVMILFGGLGVMIGIHTNFALTLISIFLIIVNFNIHKFWKISDLNLRNSEMISFTKNLTLLGATLMMYSFLSPWDYSPAINLFSFFN